MTDFYADPSLYDILYTPGTAAEVDGLERVERRFADQSLPADRLWFEPACGTGRYLRVAAGRGRRVAGFDRDAGQIAYARRRLKKSQAQLFVADMVDFAAAVPRSWTHVRPRFAFNPVNSLRHLADDEAMLRHLKQMSAVMAPGGLYVIGISLVDYSQLATEEDLWRGRRGRCAVSQLVNYLPPEPGTDRARVESVLSHLTVTRPRGEEHFDCRYDLHCCDEDQWRDLLRQAGLKRLPPCDGSGRPLAGRQLPYQLEVIRFGDRSA